jgi:hypothetical protein
MYRAALQVVAIAAFILAGLYAWQHFHPAGPPAIAEQQKEEPDLQSPESKLAQETVVVRGPLADYMRSNDPVPEQETHPAARQSSPADHIVEDSPVGTGRDILRKTFAVRSVIHVRFQIPPHALTPRFHGTFRSLVGGETSHDGNANVDLLLMNEKQYAAFAADRDSEALYIADTTHFRDISVDLPPSHDLPAHYYLVFRNSPGGADEKSVEADFRVDF